VLIEEAVWSIPDSFFFVKRLKYTLYTEMKKEELFDDDFLKQFRTGEELSDFIRQLVR